MVFTGHSYALDTVGIPQAELTQTYPVNQFFTVELWFNTNNKDRQSLVSEYTNGNINTTHNILLAIENNKIYAMTYNFFEIGSYADNAWTHVAYRCSLATSNFNFGGITTFINGGNKNKLSGSDCSKTWLEKTYFGLASSAVKPDFTKTAYFNFRGAIAAFRVYNYALTDAEILASYNNVLTRFNGYTGTPYIVLPAPIAIVATNLVTRLDPASGLTTFENRVSRSVTWTATGTTPLNQIFKVDFDAGMALGRDVNDWTSAPLLTRTPLNSNAIQFEGFQFTTNSGGINPATAGLTAAFTMEIWFRAASNASGTLVHEFETSATNHWGRTALLGIKNNTVTVQFRINSRNYFQYTIGTYIPTSWNCVGFTYVASTRSIRGYLNGSFMGNSQTDKFWPSPAFIGFGADCYTHPAFKDGLGFLIGEIGDFKLYNRALTDAEMRQNFNSLAPRFDIPRI